MTDWNVQVAVIVLVRGGDKDAAVDAAVASVNSVLKHSEYEADADLADAFESELLPDEYIDIYLTETPT